MSIYIVKNERNVEVSAYTDLHRAEIFAEELQSLVNEHYRVEELSFSCNGPQFSESEYSVQN
jgi:hypothetical protein